MEFYRVLSILGVASIVIGSVFFAVAQQKQASRENKEFSWEEMKDPGNGNLIKTGALFLMAGVFLLFLEKAVK